MSRLLISAALSALAFIALPATSSACPGKEHAKGEHAGCDKANCAHKGDKAACAKADCPHKGDKAACDCANKDGKDTKAESLKFKMVPLEEVATLAAKPGQVTILDVNNDKTRADEGVVKGAKLLASASQYDVKELPAAKDAKLVFYCANTRCTASHVAANKAVEAGYTDVGVMPEGIKGWKAAGKPLETPRS